MPLRNYWLFTGCPEDDECDVICHRPRSANLACDSPLTTSCMANSRGDARQEGASNETTVDLSRAGASDRAVAADLRR